MNKKSGLITLILILILVLNISIPAAAFSQSDLAAVGFSNDALQLQSPETDPPPPPLEETPYFHTEEAGTINGEEFIRTVIGSPPQPPDGYVRTVATDLPEPHLEAGINTLSEVPAFTWVHGCSATSAAMIASYYDRMFFANMYTGPTNSSVVPMNNSTWGYWTDSYGASRAQMPLSASRQGLDGRATRGGVDDYWRGYGNNDPDPFIGNWSEHSYGDSIGDYMRTNQSSFDNPDGSTSFYTWTTNPEPFTCSQMEGYGIQDDGTVGVKNFYEARGYTVTECYNQLTDVPDGFSFEDYKAEIDAGYPVMFHVHGHTMVGVGYNDSGQTMYIHDTWDYNIHTMTWGGSYNGMDMYAASIVHLQREVPLPPSNLNASNITSYQVTLSWEKASDAKYIDGYRIYQNNVAVVTTTDIEKTLSLTCGTDYNFKVRAYAEDQESIPSNTVNITSSECPVSYDAVERWSTDFNYDYQGWTVDLHPRFVGDVNGDGFDDVVGFGEGGVWISLSRGTTTMPVFEAVAKWSEDLTYNKGWRTDMHPRMLADVNGDGKMDILGYFDDGVYVALSNGFSFDPATKWSPDFNYIQGWRIDSHIRTTGDVNGDGSDDLIGFGGTGVWVAISNGVSGFGEVTRWSTDFNYDYQGWRVELHPRFAGDVNGDGRDDIIGFGEGGVWVTLAKTDEPGFEPVTKWSEDLTYNKGWRTDMHPRMLADINADNKMDILGYYNDGVYAAVSNGSSFYPAFKASPDFNYEQGWRIETHIRTVGDINGDGKDELAGFGGTGLWFCKAN